MKTKKKKTKKENFEKNENIKKKKWKQEKRKVWKKKENPKKKTACLFRVFCENCFFAVFIFSRFFRFLKTFKL